MIKTLQSLGHSLQLQTVGSATQWAVLLRLSDLKPFHINTSGPMWGELHVSRPGVGHIPIAEFVAHAAEQHLKNDIGRHLDKVEWGAAACIVSSTADFAAKHIVAQVGFPLER